MNDYRYIGRNYSRYSKKLIIKINKTLSVDKLGFSIEKLLEEMEKVSLTDVRIEEN